MKSDYMALHVNSGLNMAALKLSLVFEFLALHLGAGPNHDKYVNFSELVFIITRR